LIIDVDFGNFEFTCEKDRNFIIISVRVFFGIVFFIALIAATPHQLRCQSVTGISIFPGKSIFVYPKYTIALASDLTNSGSFGSDKGATILFSGQRWINKAGSMFPDESITGTTGIGGVFKFAGQASSPQYIENKNNLQLGSEFPNISIANSQNVILEGSDLAIRNNLNFESGRLILNTRNVSIGVEGSITGYNENRFIVTGTTTRGGALIRRVTGQQQTDIVFPIGSSVNSYTPASIKYTGLPQDLKLRVFENVYDKALYGVIDKFFSVKKTWNLALIRTDNTAQVSINLQHNSIEEGSAYTGSSSQSFISRFLADKEQWDTAPASAVSPGVLTTTNPIPNSFVSSRTNLSDLSSNEYFSKAVRKSNGLAMLRIPEGISPNGDGKNDRFVIQNMSLSDNLSLEIYNKEQRIVYKDLNYSNTFEGIGNQNEFVNSTLPIGTYYFLLKVNEERSIRGFFIINK